MNTQTWIQIGFVPGNGISNSPKEYYFVNTNNLAGKYLYRLKQIDNDRTFKYYEPITVEILVKNFEIFQNYPNPFNPSTVINYQLMVNSKVMLKVYDVLGNEVATLVDEEKPAGYHSVKFDGSKLSSGVYFYTIKAGDYFELKKMTLVK